MRKLLAPLWLAATTLSACAVGPDYRQPAVTPHAEGPFVSAAPVGAASTEPRDDWWRLYDDPALDGLVGRALAANTDLRVAEANLARARAVLSEARAGLFPSTGVSASGGYGKSNVAGSRAEWSYQAGFDVNYQLDLFGRVRRTVEASRADAARAGARLGRTDQQLPHGPVHAPALP